MEDSAVVIEVKKDLVNFYVNRRQPRESLLNFLLTIITIDNGLFNIDGINEFTLKT